MFYNLAFHLLTDVNSSWGHLAQHQTLPAIVLCHMAIPTPQSEVDIHISNSGCYLFLYTSAVNLLSTEQLLFTSIFRRALIVISVVKHPVSFTTIIVKRKVYKLFTYYSLIHWNYVSYDSAESTVSNSFVVIIFRENVKIYFI